MSTQVIKLPTTTQLTDSLVTAQAFTYYNPASLPNILLANIQNTPGSSQGIKFKENELVILAQKYPTQIDVRINIKGELVIIGADAASYALDVNGNLIYTPYTLGTKWIGVTAAAESTNGWNSVCFGNGLFVSVAISGTGNRAMTSPDGITWTVRTTPADNFWSSICYGNNLFVAVAYSGTGNRVMTSPDGITWTIRASAADNDWRDVCFGNGLFVAVCTNGSTTQRVMTSPDGITWTLRTTPTSSSCSNVVFGSGIFVATGTGIGTTRLMTSVDGINWVSGGGTSMGDSLCFGNGIFVGVLSGTVVKTSPDGITWTTQTAAANLAWSSVCFGNGVFCAVAGNVVTQQVMTSDDGATWVQQTAPTNQWSDICFGADTFVAVTTTQTHPAVMYSKT